MSLKISILHHDIPTSRVRPPVLPSALSPSNMTSALSRTTVQRQPLAWLVDLLTEVRILVYENNFKGVKLDVKTFPSTDGRHLQCQRPTREAARRKAKPLPIKHVTTTTRVSYPVTTVLLVSKQVRNESLPQLFKHCQFRLRANIEGCGVPYTMYRSMQRITCSVLALDLLTRLQMHPKQLVLEKFCVHKTRHRRQPSLNKLEQ